MYNGLLIYLALFVVRPAEIYPFLEPFHLERVVGIIILMLMIKQNKLLFGIVNPVNTAILIFLCVALISIPTAAWPSNAVEWFIDLLKKVALFLMIIGLIDTKEKFRTFIWVFTLLMAWVAWSPFWNGIHGNFGSIDYTFGKFYRAEGYSFADDPNSLATTLVQTLPFLFFLIITETTLRSKLVLISISALLFYTIILTGSRTGIIGVFAFVLVLWLKSSRKILVLLLIAVLFVSFWSTLNKQQKTRYASILQETSTETRDNSSQLRINAWNDGWALFLERPITGWGIGCYSSARGKRFGHYMWPHNLYIQLLSELGVAGVIAFILMLYYIFRNIYQARKLRRNLNMTADWYYHLTNALEICLIVRLVMGIFGHSLYHYIWYFVAGLSVVMLHFVKTETDKREKGVEKNVFICTNSQAYNIPFMGIKRS